jgi:hypothetical protein
MLRYDWRLGIGYRLGFLMFLGVVLRLPAASGQELREPALPVVSEVESQPLKASVERLMAALDYLGEPLSVERRREVEQALRMEAGEAATALQRALDPLALVGVNINPESRVKGGSWGCRGEADSAWLERISRQGVQRGGRNGEAPSRQSPCGSHPSAFHVVSRTGSDDFRAGCRESLDGCRDVRLTAADSDAVGLLVEYRIAAGVQPRLWEAGGVSSVRCGPGNSGHRVSQ